MRNKPTKRRKVIMAQSDDITIKVTVETVDNYSLTIDEHDRLLTHLVDDCMIAVRSAPFVHVPLSKMKLA
jgi:hypothetical protein